MEQTTLKDFFGTPALDYGSWKEMTRKYGDNYFIWVTDQPPPDCLFQDGYVLEIGGPKDEGILREKSSSYKKKMHAAGHLSCGTSVVCGEKLYNQKMDGFMGGAGVI